MLSGFSGGKLKVTYPQCLVVLYFTGYKPSVLCNIETLGVCRSRACDDFQLINISYFHFFPEEILENLIVQSLIKVPFLTPLPRGYLVPTKPCSRSTLRKFSVNSQRKFFGFPPNIGQGRTVWISFPILDVPNLTYLQQCDAITAVNLDGNFGIALFNSAPDGIHLLSELLPGPENLAYKKSFYVFLAK